MAKVTGLGGVFFRAADTKAIGQWYQKWLGLPVEHPYGASIPHKQLSGEGISVWAPFEKDTTYFGDSGQVYMINLMVDDLPGALAQVRQGGAEVMDKTEESEFGHFGWFIDPEGNKVELWQPPA